VKQPYLQVIAHYQVRPEEIETVLELLSRLAQASREEPGNLGYEFYQGVEDPGHVVILERYTDEAGLDAHRESDHFRSLGREQIIPRLVSRVVESYQGTAGA
jgi:quinol monooxygenase YgiN